MPNHVVMKTEVGLLGKLYVQRLITNCELHAPLYLLNVWKSHNSAPFSLTIH